MKIRFLDDTNIRTAPRINDNQPVGMMFKGSEIEVEHDVARGDAIQNIDRWYHDKNGWFYWSGMTEQIEEEQPPPGDTTGGVMVFPASPSELPETDETDPENPLPPLANDDALMSNEDIPVGETRLVPSLEALLEAERRVRAGIGSLPKPVAELESVSMQEPSASADASAAGRPVSTDPAPGDVSTPPDTAPERRSASGPVLWQNPTPQKLNWGVQNNLIARDWWQTRNLSGRGTTIAILSTGADVNHPDLANLLGQFAGNSASVADLHGLGTQAAIVAAGCGLSVFGVAPGAGLLIGKLGDQDHLLSPDGLIAGLRWAIEARADVVAMLVDFPDLSVRQLEELQIQVNRAIDLGIMLVAPVGTAENKKPESRYPARLTGVLSVGAHDQYNQRSAFSARSFELDLLAPGEGLLTSNPNRQTLTNLKSTSIAAAFTAGMLALIRQWQLENKQPVSPALAFDLLRNTAAPRRNFNRGEDVEYGYGLLNPIEVMKQLERSGQTPG